MVLSQVVAHTGATTYRVYMKAVIREIIVYEEIVLLDKNRH